MVTRRCAQRQLLLRPCATTTAIFAYVLGVAAKRYRVSVHAFCVMSNHCRDKWRRIEALQRLTTFLRVFREAFRAWARGVRDVVFPAGTYLMQVHHGVSCAAAD